MQIGKQNWPYLDKSLGFNIPEYDSIDLGYTNTNLTSVTYTKNGVTVATLILTYTNDILTKVTQT